MIKWLRLYRNRITLFLLQSSSVPHGFELICVLQFDYKIRKGSLEQKFKLNLRLNSHQRLKVKSLFRIAVTMNTNSVHITLYVGRVYVKDAYSHL